MAKSLYVITAVALDEEQIEGLFFFSVYTRNIMQVKSFICDHPNLHASNMVHEPYQEKVFSGHRQHKLGKKPRREGVPKPKEERGGATLEGESGEWSLPARRERKEPRRYGSRRVRVLRAVPVVISCRFRSVPGALRWGEVRLPLGVVACPLLFDWYLWIGLVLSPGRPASGMYGVGFGLPVRSFVRSGHTIDPSTNAIGITR